MTRTPPPTRAVPSDHEQGQHIAGPDLVIGGSWTKGKEQAPELPSLRSLSLIETVRRVRTLVKELEERYPGAEITATVTPEAMTTRACGARSVSGRVALDHLRADGTSRSR
ncbi:hypothetical protein ACF09I_31495 [Streptomyces sp. NPDC014940]|uniref:hypothetical protein n=1 Tax=Streptomyces sp. NPDC014940 TaxID=3364932 RepID=UPI0036FC975A